jgi:rod shape-determining protein MreC
MDSQAQPFFVRGPSAGARLAFFVALGLVLMFVDARFTYLKQARAALAAAVYPLQRLAQWPGEGLDRVNAFFVTQQKLQQDNVAVRQRLLEQSQQLQRMQALEEELATLRRVLGAKEQLPAASVLVELLHVDRNPFLRKIVVDKGTKDGVAAGQAVIDADGVIGQVTLAAPLSSEVTLVTEKGHPTPVMVQRTGLRAVLFGSGRPNALELPFVPVNADIETGDVLVTSGIDSTYPPGLAVARVTNIERNAAYVFAKITCAPAAGVDRNKFYLVLEAGTAQPNVAAQPAAPAQPAAQPDTSKSIPPSALPNEAKQTIIPGVSAQP